MKRFFGETLPKVLLPRSTPEKRGELSVSPQQTGRSLLQASVSADEGTPRDFVPLSGKMIDCYRKDQALLLGVLNDLNEKNPQTGKNLKKIEDSSKEWRIFLDAAEETHFYLSSKTRVIYFNENCYAGERSYMPAIRLGVVLDNIANPKKPEYRNKKSAHAADAYRIITTTAFQESHASSTDGAEHEESAERSGASLQAPASFECEPEISRTKAISAQSPPPPKGASSGSVFTELWSEDPPRLRPTSKRAPAPQQGFGALSAGRSRSSSASRGRD